MVKLVNDEINKLIIIYYIISEPRDYWEYLGL